MTPPEDRDEWAARVRIVHALVEDARGTQGDATAALLTIAADALDTLSGLIGRTDCAAEAEPA